MVWDVVVAKCMRGKVLRMETLELGVWVAVAVEMVAQTSRWKECRRLLQWRLDWAKKVVLEMVVVVGEGMPMVVARERWVQLAAVAAAMWVEVVW